MIVCWNSPTSKKTLKFALMFTCCGWGRMYARWTVTRNRSRTRWEKCFQYFILEPMFIEIYFIFQTEGKKSLNSSPSNSLKEFDSDIDLSRFRIQASSSIARYSLFFNKRKLGQNSPRKASNGSFVFSVSDSKPFIVTPCSRNSNLKQCIQVTYECLMSFEGTKLSGFLNMASEKWCWNRLWCEIDGICLNFWTYPQDSNDLVRMPLPVYTICKKRRPLV